MSAPVLIIELRASPELIEVLRALAAQISPASRATSAPASAAPAGIERADVSSQPLRKAPDAPGGKLAKRAARKSPPVSARWRVWTDERRDLLRRDWPKGVPVSQIREELNLLPGPEILDNERVAITAASLGLRRPPSSHSAQRGSSLKSRDGLPSVAQRQLHEAAAANTEAPIAWADAMTWAHRNGVTLGGSEEEDLRATNRARRDAGLTPYRIIERRGPPEALPDARVGGKAEGVAA